MKCGGCFLTNDMVDINFLIVKYTSMQMIDL